VQCAKCGTRNPRDVTACLGCGESLLAPAPPPRRMPLRLRLLISALIGLLVFAISCDVGYRLFSRSAVRYTQHLTFQSISGAVKAVEQYRDEKHALPRELADVEWQGSRVDADGTPVDVWQRPLHYSVDGSRFRIVSYGQDGMPGGEGLDYDLSSDDLPKGKPPRVTSMWAGLPRRSVPTFRQFVTYDRDSGNGSGRMMFLMSILAGVVASALSLREIGKPIPGEEASMPRWLRLFIIIGGTLLIAIMYLIPLHLPSGH
jgi:hypothetical protein